MYVTISPTELFLRNFGFTSATCSAWEKNVTEKPESYGQIVAGGLSLT